MGKIKNWSTTEEAENFDTIKYSWENDSFPMTVLVEDLGGGYAAHNQIHDDRLEMKHSNLEFDRTFKTQEDARKFAVNWMKKHPLNNVDRGMTADEVRRMARRSDFVDRATEQEVERMLDQGRVEAAKDLIDRVEKDARRR